MDFRDEIIDKIDQSDSLNITKMIIEYLCGEKYYSPLKEKEKILLKKLLNKVQTDGIKWAQLNELLLLLNQDRVSGAFFKFFFGEGIIKLEELKKGIIKFRGFAMLCFGNYRFAYKQLIRKNEQELQEALYTYHKNDEGEEKFKARLPKALDIEDIERDKTWYTGFISKRKYEKEANYLTQLLKGPGKSQGVLSLNNLLELKRIYEKIAKDIKQVETKALRNTDVYLTWDYMDVYVATSMRQRWEFEETWDFIQSVFKSNRLKGMGLRYFDPTQCQCENRIDKGLVEGLMLKRASCAIYMAQDAETLGKDSELAVTLAQGKPVIAYVPVIDIVSYTEKIKKYPLDYFRFRFPILQAEGIFNDENCIKKLRECDNNFIKIIRGFITELDNYYEKQPFSLWVKQEDAFKQKSKFFASVCKLLAIAQQYSYDSRAKLLKENHPLAIQVDLKKGIANGLLVVRSADECTDLLYKILTNTVEFTIKHVGEESRGVTILEEAISKCPFRVVTDYKKLTNSFWNFYLYLEQ